MFEQLFNNPFLYSLSLTLLHFLWQGLLVGLVLKSALLIIHKNRSKLRYALASFSMLANLVLAVITFIIIDSDVGTRAVNNLSPIPLNNLVNELTLESNTFTYQELITSIVAYSLPYLSILWFATIIVLAGKLLIEVRSVNHLSIHATVLPDDDLLLRFNQLVKQIKLRKTPKLLISLKVDVPMAIGWLKPVVLLPASMVTGLNTAQLEMLLLHELAHIRRHDYLVNFIQTLIETLFFFHPCVHWIGKQVRNEREYCSDDVAVQHCGDAIAYAHTLTDTASLCAKKHCHTIPTMAMAASGGDLKARVVRLVDHHCAPSNDKGKWLAALSLLLAIVLMGVNQLLTAPFAYELNSQLPWYDGNNITSKLELYPANSELIAKSKDNILLANNSIALQLLNRTDENTKHSLKNDIRSLTKIDLQPEANSYQTLFDANKVVATSQVNKPDTINEKLSVTKSNVQTTTKIAQIKVTAKNNLSPITKDLNAESKKSSLEQNQQLAKNSMINNPTLNMNTGDIPSNQSKTFKIDRLSVSSAPRTLFIDSPNKHSDLSWSIENIATANTQKSTELDEELAANTTSIQQQSYSEAIDEFELQNDIYTAAHASRSKDNANFTSSKTQLAIKEETKKTTSIGAKLLNPTSPVYPNIAKLRGLEMEVKVNFTVDRNGKVKDIYFGKQHNVTYFKSAIRSAIRKWRFTPATVNNDIVETKMSKIFSFSLQS